jgi:DNA-binding MarR family transcriptional regulator
MTVEINIFEPMSNPRLVPFDATLHVKDHCLCLHAQRAARALARRFDRAFRPLDLTNGQFSLLMSLNRPGPASMGSVATLLAMDRTTLTAALKPLERRGLVVSGPGSNDRRSRVLTLTSAGLELLAQAVPIWRSTHAEVDGEIEPRHDGVSLREALRAVGELGQAPAEGTPASRGESEGAARP